MFPQLVETIYSPALPGIATSYHVSSERAAQTLSVYFVAFAVGVAMWGWLSDCIGRRRAMMAGLLCYATGSLMAVVATDFSVLLLARMVSAIGAAADGRTADVAGQPVGGTLGNAEGALRAVFRRDRPKRYDHRRVRTTN